MADRTPVITLLLENRKALFDYEIVERFEAGVVLTGAEVKSIRAKSANLRGAYVSIRRGEAWLVGWHISAYKQATQAVHDPKRDRKLLLKRRDITNLTAKQHERGMSIVPTEVYTKGSLIKIRIGLARGRKRHDKKQLLKERDINREAERAIKHGDYGE
ncbi:MAG TPA: SsrA-binding protein SmpB [bacterium]|nr:SsrA-binding protein SmpB [bacterium]